MNHCSVLPVHSLAILIGASCVVSGSLVLTSSPATATDGQLFTMMCTGNQGGSRAWSRNEVSPVLYTHQGRTTTQLVSPLVTRDLVGRFNVSSSDDGTQHNVTLMINARTDNDDVWKCTDEIKNEGSNLLTIAAVTTSTTLTSKVTTQSTTTRTSTSALPSVEVASSSITSVSIRTHPTARQESGIYAIPSAYDDTSNLYCELGTTNLHAEGETIPSSSVDTQDQTIYSSFVDTQEQTASSSDVDPYDQIGNI